MLAIVSRLFFCKSIAWRLLRNFADNFTNIKLIIFPLSGSDHPDKYLYEIGRRSKILWLFILKFLAKWTVTFFVEEKTVKLSINNFGKESWPNS